MIPLRKIYWVILITCLLIFSAGGCSKIIPTPTPMPTFTNTPEPPTPTPIPPTDTPLPPTETPTEAPTNTPPPPPTITPIPPTATPSGKPIYIYFIEREGSQKCGGELVPILSGMHRTTDLIKNVEVALGQQFLYRTQNVLSLYNPLFKSKLSVADVDTGDAGNKIIAMLSGEITLNEECDGPSIFAILQAVIRQFPGPTGNPDITLNGIGIKNFLY